MRRASDPFRRRNSLLPFRQQFIVYSGSQDRLAAISDEFCYNGHGRKAIPIKA